MLHGMVFTKLNKAAKSLGKEENKLLSNRRVTIPCETKVTRIPDLHARVRYAYI